MALQCNQLLQSCDYKIQTATAEDRPAIFEFIKKFFYTSEPLNEALNRARNETPNHKIEDNLMLYLSEGLSLMAMATSGEIVGVALNAKVKPEDVFGTSDNSAVNSCLDSIHKLLTHVEEKITELGKLADEIKEMEVRVITVHENWRNKGIGRVLLEHSKNLAQQKGFKQIRSICTSAYTAKMFIRCGFQCIYALEYKDCEKRGIIDFLPQEPHTHIKGVILKF